MKDKEDYTLQQRVEEAVSSQGEMEEFEKRALAGKWLGFFSLCVSEGCERVALNSNIL